MRLVVVSRGEPIHVQAADTKGSEYQHPCDKCVKLPGEQLPLPFSSEPLLVQRTAGPQGGWGCRHYPHHPLGLEGSNIT